MQGLRLGQEASLHGAYGKPTQTHRIMIAKEKAGVDTHQARLLGRVLVEQAGHSRTQHKLEKKGSVYQIYMGPTMLLRSVCLLKLSLVSEARHQDSRRTLR